MNLAEKGSTIPIINPPSKAPGSEPSPPMTAAAKAFIPIRPTEGSTAPLKAYKIPDNPATDPAKTQVKVCSLFTGTPTYKDAN